MNRVLRHLWISSLRPRTVSAALALTIVLAMAVFTAESLQAQTFTLLQTFNYTNGAQPYNDPGPFRQPVWHCVIRRNWMRRLRLRRGLQAGHNWQGDRPL